MNPLLPEHLHIPDAEAHVMPDGRLYLYGSMDEPGSGGWCSTHYHVFSTDDPTLKTWVDHGVSFDSARGDVPFAPNGSLWAPDAIHKDGVYYLYFCGQATDGRFFEGVATSDRPEGPFTDAQPIAYADGDSIDPAIFIDDDGTAYYLWGQGALKGCRMMDDMQTLDLSTLHETLITEEEHGFHEGASLRKRGDTYYLVYTDISRGRATCIGYATAKHPLGPYTKGGIIVDNTYCDPESWNNHGSIECFHDQWFVFYHRSSRGEQINRRVCAEPITFLDDGSIPEVPITLNGAEPPLDATQTIHAAWADRVRGNIRIGLAEDGHEVLVNCGGGPMDALIHDWAEYRKLNFDGLKDSDAAPVLLVAANGEGRITVYTEGRTVLASFALSTGEGLLAVPLLTTLSGDHTVWFSFEGRGITLDHFTFAALSHE